MKKSLALLLIVGMSFIFSSCGTSDDNTLVVSTWAFGADSIEELWVKPFEEKTGVDVILDTGGTGERFSKVQSNPNHGVDIMFTSQYYEALGQKDGLWKEIDSSKLSNLDKLYDSAKAPNGANYGPAYTYNRLSIVYNPNLISEVDSMDDVLNNDEINAITIPTIQDTHGPSLLQEIANTIDVDLYTQEGEDAVFKEVEKLSKKVVKPYTSSTDVINLMKSEEAQLALVPEYYFNSIQEVVPDVKWVDPKEGAVLNFNTIDITATTEKEDLAYEFIDFIISTPIQSDVADAQLDPPVNKEVQLEEYIKGIPFTSIDEFETVNYTEAVNNMKDWENRWNEIFG